MVAALAMGANLTVLKDAWQGFKRLQIRSPIVALLATVLPMLMVNLAVADSRTYGLVVVGLGGNNDYREMFEEAASVTIDAINPPTAATTPVTSNDSSSLSSGNSSGNSQEGTEASGGGNQSGGLKLLLENEANREAILAEIAAQVELANQQPETSRFMLILFGHGNFDGEHYRFNTKGPDITASEIREALRPLQSPRQFLLFGTSASGAVLDVFEQNTEEEQNESTEASDNDLQRVVVTATKSGAEANAVQFPRYWSEVLAGQLADTDHNELLTVMEAYKAVSEGVARHYDNRQLLATEHSRVIVDSEDSMVLARLGSLRGQENNVEVNRLLDERQQLEVEFNRVRATRDTRLQSEYLDELEQVLLNIAKLQLRIDRATGWQPDDGNESGLDNGGQSGG